MARCGTLVWVYIFTSTMRLGHILTRLKENSDEQTLTLATSLLCDVTEQTDNNSTREDTVLPCKLSNYWSVAMEFQFEAFVPPSMP